MPVLGHAFVGLVLGTWIRPKSLSVVSSTKQPISSESWVLLVVGLSYVPDTTAQLILLAGGQDARLITHSVLFAVIVAIGLAPLLTLLVSQSVCWTFTFVLGCVLLHDGLDLAQATDRTPLWPFSHRQVGYDPALFPSDLTTEAILFGGFALFACGIRILTGRSRGGKNEPEVSSRSYPSAMRGMNGGIIVLIMLAAAGTHYLRDIREDQLKQGRILSQEQHAFDRALAQLEQAERWPSTAKPGRIDYLRAWTYQQLGDRQRAEEYYLRSYRADPMYFWTVADLALFYAASDESSDVRRHSVSPYLHHLRQSFPEHDELSRVLANVEQALAATRTSATKPSLSLGDRKPN